MHAIARQMNQSQRGRRHEVPCQQPNIFYYEPSFLKFALVRLCATLGSTLNVNNPTTQALDRLQGVNNTIGNLISKTGKQLNKHVDATAQFASVFWGAERA